MKVKIHQVLSWILYDFANAPFSAVILTFIFSTYYTQAIAPDEVTGTFRWAVVMTLSGLSIGLVSPFFGAIADQSGRKKPWLITFAAIVIALTCWLSFVQPTPVWGWLSLLLIFLASTFYQISQVFYNALLITVAPQPLIGRISGLGWGAAYLGGLICLVITLFFLMPHQNLTPSAMTQGVSYALLLVALWYALFSLPLVFLLEENKKKCFSFQDVKQGIAQLITTVGSLKQQTTLSGFLIAYFFYSDAIATIMSFGGIYAATVLGFSLYEVILFAIVINCVAGVGAMIFGMIDDRIGPSRLILYALCACLFASIMVLSFQTRGIFWFFGCFLGIFIGPIQSASRSMFSQIVDQDQITEMFGLYALTGKLSTFIGPLCISLITHFFRSRTAGMFVVVVMFAIGFVLMRRFFHLKFKKSLWDLMKWW